MRASFSNSSHHSASTASNKPATDGIVFLTPQTTTGDKGNRTRFRWWGLLIIVLILLPSLRLGSMTTYYASSSDEFQQKFLESVLAVTTSTNTKGDSTSASKSDSKRSSSSWTMNLFQDTTTDDNNKQPSYSNMTSSLPTINLVPKPTKLKQSPGVFALKQDTKIGISDEEAQPEAEFLAETLRASTGLPLPLHNGCESGHICFMLLDEDEDKPKSGKGDEPNLFDHEDAYVVDVRTTGAVIGAFSRRGLFYGLQTVLQLLPPLVYSTKTVQLRGTPYSWTLPLVHIEDAPRFSWRGMHLDVSRHFHPKDFVLKFINVLAIHKFNNLHLHLTEDQGWRVEIQKYPLLTKISAWRDETLVGHRDQYKHKPMKYDGKRHGGFYTQEDIREMVAYAQRRHINILPEIEMPGHTESVFAAYPQYTCQSDKKYRVKREWGVSDNVYCAGNNATFEFLENVLTEVLDLFPSQFIHVGGDECPKTHWHTCPKCQQRMRDEGLTDPKQLQSYFIKRIERFLNNKGRRLIGWDEIFEGGLAPHAAVMSWRGSDPSRRAAQAGHDTVLADVGSTYLDWYQGKKRNEPLAWGGFTPLSKIYAFEPMPRNLAPDKQHHILGAQAQLWTEYMPTTTQVEYMAFPRAAAMAEVVWLKRDKDYDDFYKRLTNGHLARLEALNVNYRTPKEPYETEY